MSARLYAGRMGSSSAPISFCVGAHHLTAPDTECIYEIVSHSSLFSCGSPVPVLEVPIRIAIPHLKEVTMTASADHGEYPMDPVRASDEAHRTPRDPSRILIVDDMADMREALAIYFRHSGFIVDTAADGVAAIEAAQRLHPDVIVMDVALPRLDGLSAMREINHDPHTAHIPVVILTAYPIRAIKGGALQTGGRFVMKPCTPQELEQHICSLLESPRSGDGRPGAR